MLSESADGPGDGGEWLSIAAAARRLGVTPRAIRNRVERGTIRWRAHGNFGREVLVTLDMASPGDGTSDRQGTDPEDHQGDRPRDSADQPRALLRDAERD